MKALAVEIVVGQDIVLLDGVSRVTVTRTGRFGDLVQIFWQWNGAERYMNYLPNDEIEVIDAS